MAKLYPPYIEGTIPAFYADGTLAELAVPFSMNRAVSIADFSGISIKIKTVQSNEFLYSAITSLNELKQIKTDFIAHFTIPIGTITKFKVGNFYKIQIAYCDASAARVPGYYSTIGVVKLTTKPNVTIADLENSSTAPSGSRLSYTGVYSQFSEDENVSMDVSEKVNEYCFNLFELNDGTDPVLLATSDWQLHNSSTDVVSYESTDQYSFTYSLKPNKYYGIEYRVRTINGLEETSGIYSIINKVGVVPEIESYADLHYEANFDNAYIRLYFTPKDKANHNYANGTFIITRASDEDDYTNWYELYKFALRNGDPLDQWEFKDFTIKHGTKYRYALQQYNAKGFHSRKVYASDPITNETYVTPDFEDSFLYDGKRQLKIRFNPKMSSFKIDKLEQKIETIGNKYPFFFRNAKVEYKEFPIGGLISYQSDEANLFIDDADLGLTTNYTSNARSAVDGTPAAVTAELNLKPYTTSHEAYNITAERIFKMEVLEWLNNGEPKLFKSPTEGNFLVRLMNVSLTPEETLGRLLHNFTATAYEIGEIDYNTLELYNIVSVEEPEELQYRLETINFYDYRKTVDDTIYTDEEIDELEGIQADTIRNTQDQLNALYAEVLEAYNLLASAADAYYTIHSPESEEEYYTRKYTLTHLEEEIYQLKASLAAQIEESQRLMNLHNYQRFNLPTIEGYLEFRDVLPGTTFYIYDSTSGEEFSETIGVTGALTIKLDGHKFSGIRVAAGEELPAFGLLTYRYLAKADNSFDKIYDIDMEQIPRRQFIGPCTIIDANNDFDMINDFKRALINFYSPWIEHKKIETIYWDHEYENGPIRVRRYDPTQINFAQKKQEFIDESLLLPTVIYKTYMSEFTWRYCMWQYNAKAGEYRWTYTTEPQVLDYSITIDGSKLIVPVDSEAEVISHLLSTFTDQGFKSLELGDGLTLDLTYTYSETTYNIEQTDGELIALKNEYLTAMDQYISSITTGKTSQEIQRNAATVDAIRNRYCSLLKEKIQE